jgi:SAM-dependent methyltransferase
MADAEKEFWSEFAREWRPEKAKMPFLEPDEAEAYIEQHVTHLGDEWSIREDLDEVLDEFVYPYVDSASRALEIGVGGGRVAALLAPRVEHLHCVDVSPEMLEHARDRLSSIDNVTLTLVEGIALPAEWSGTFDFAFSFDVLVHLNLHVVWGYLRQFRRVLKDGGRAFIHTANLATPLGWQKFQRIKDLRAGHFKFTTPEAVELLAERAGFNVVKRSTPSGDNMYFDRDYLALLQHAGQGTLRP